jgi:hypothetical protein
VDTEPIQALRKKIQQQAEDAIRAGRLETAQSCISKLKRLEIVANELDAIADESSGGSSSEPSAAPVVPSNAPGSGLGNVKSALVRISGGDLRRNLFRLADAKRHGMQLPSGPVTIDLIASSGTRTIQTEAMDYKFRARKEFGKYYAELRLNADDQLVVEQIASAHFRIRKP